MSPWTIVTRRVSFFAFELDLVWEVEFDGSERIKRSEISAPRQSRIRCLNRELKVWRCCRDCICGKSSASIQARAAAQRGRRTLPSEIHAWMRNEHTLRVPRSPQYLLSVFSMIPVC